MESKDANNPHQHQFSDSKKRMFQCFVCAERLDTFDAFKEHVTKEHEEGREYLLCPLSRCQAPVRDMKAHFAAKHPHEKIPKTVANRAIIWKDISTKNGKMNTKKPHFRDGYMLSDKNGREMHYRSGMECEVYELLERWNDVMKYEEEPFPVKYAFVGSMHDYFPDIKIHYRDGTTEIWEVKPSSQTQLAKNKAKWAACSEHCIARGWKFMVLTEKGVKKLRAKIKLQLAARNQSLNDAMPLSPVEGLEDEGESWVE